jgi:ABC-2 type transport system ATP-binding protein
MPVPGLEGLLLASQLSKSFGSTAALSGLTCEVRGGEVVGLLGPNGAGKTTSMRLFLGLLKPSSGSATILGRDATRDALEVKRLIGYVPDEPAFYHFLSGRETIDFVLTVRGIPPEAAWPRLDRLVEVLDFEGQLDTLVGGYSHGMKKKLALLLALAHEPRLLLLDEPTNGLDPPTAARVRELFRHLASEGVGVLLSTHLLDMADRLCDRMLILDHGKMVAEGTRESIRARAAVPPDATLEDAFLALVK